MVNKKKVFEYLNNKNIKIEVDEIIIDELIFNQYLIKEAKKDIKERGLNINVSKGETPYYQTNPSISTYNQSVKNILNISRKLGLSPLDRKNLKIDSSSIIDDGFDD